jgi:hypothetical protein
MKKIEKPVRRKRIRVLTPEERHKRSIGFAEECTVKGTSRPEIPELSNKCDTLTMMQKALEEGAAKAMESLEDKIIEALITAINTQKNFKENGETAEIRKAAAKFLAQTKKKFSTPAGKYLLKVTGLE